MINLGGNALNVYLADLRKNRKLRSNERKRNATDGIVLLDTEVGSIGLELLTND